MAAAAASSTNLTFRHRPTPPPHFPSFRRLPPPFSCFLPTSSTAVSTSISISISIVSHALAAPSPLPLRSRSKRSLRVLAVAEEEVTAVTTDEVGGADDAFEEAGTRARPCELYVCNLPRSCDIAHLSDLFKPYGTVLSVEVSRDADTGISRGCGYITMSSISEAKAAIGALDGTDLGGREIRVKFSVDMVSGRTNTEALNTAPKKDMVFESPHKVYVGNLAWSVRPEDLREHFSQFGTVVSTRVLYDRKGGKHRVYGFLSFSSADELKSAIETSGSVFHGRSLLVREVVNREAQSNI